MVKRIKNNAVVYCVGAFGYLVLELLWRGYSHWTMAVTGGVCFLLIYKIDTKLKGGGIVIKCLAGSAIVTAAELIAGIIINIALKWNVWDYSYIPLNYLGQICALYSFFWFVLCFPLFALCKYLKRLIG